MIDIDPYTMHVMAQTIREGIRSQDWKPFRRYEERYREINGPFFVVNDHVTVTASAVYIGCSDGEIRDSSGELATDASVINLYTNPRVFERKANAERMLQALIDELGF